MKKLMVLMAAMMTFASTAFAEIGSLSSDLVFTPVKPCRIMDTRNAGANSGILAAGSTRTFYANSTASNYPSQGSSNPTCLLPFTSDVAGVVLNFTVVTPDTGGYITAYPGDVADVDKPLAATVNFTAGSVVGNNATLKISQASADGAFKIFSTAATHVVADIVGFYAKPVVTALQCVDTASTTVNIAIGGTANAVAPACAAGYTQTATNCEASDWLVPFVFFHGGTCSARNNSGGAQDIRASRTCCRIPGR